MKKVFSIFLAFQILFAGNFLVWAEELPPPPQEEEPEPEPDPEPEPPQEDPDPEPPQEEPEEPDLFTIQLNEILADSVEPDAQGEFIELYNSGDQAIDLSGWQLDDEVLDDTHVYTFDDPQINYVLEPDSYLTFFRPETAITLNNDGDAVYLFDDQMDEIDSFVFESSSVGRSWGRDVENPEQWILLPAPSPNAANGFLNNPPVADIQVQGGTGGMKINVTGENSSDPDGDKLTYLWEFEPGIFNEVENPVTYEFQAPGDKLVKLTVTDEFGLSDETLLPFIASNGEEEQQEEVPQEPEDETPEEEGDSEGEANIYPKLSLINELLPDPVGADGEGEWVELYNSTDKILDLSGWYLDDEEGASAAFKIPDNTKLNAKSYLVFQGPTLNLSLKNSADVIRLLNPNKEETEKIKYSDSKEGLTYAKNTQNVFTWTSFPSPKALNLFPPPPKAYLPGVIRFESVLPNPEGTDTGKEKILLKNTSGETINLAGWKLANSAAEKELLTISIPANSKKELTSADFGLTLKNTDENLRLLDPTGQVIDEISWKTSAENQWLFNTNSLQNGMTAIVKEVVDGDTFKIIFEDKTLTVRLLGVDTPEIIHPFKPVEVYGKQASDYLKNLLNGKEVRLNFEENKIDSYGRVLAYVYLNDQFVNADIIKQGYGYAYTRFQFQFLVDFVAYQAEAKAAGLGLWADPEVAAEIEKTIQDALSQPEGELAENGALLTLDAEGVLVEEDPQLPEESTKTEESELQASGTESQDEADCHSEFIKIDSFLPAPKVGEEEYIKLINTNSEQLCLTGWQLDDVEEGGSKPFVFKEGQIEAGEVSEFKKTVTKLSLNNSNDCVTLLSPSGEVADQICYEKTHENEVFTHAGGQGVVSKSTSNTSSTTKKKTSTKSTKPSTSTSKDTPKHAFSRESSAYRLELTNRSFLGRILGMDEDEKMLVVQLEDKKMLPVSYAHSLFNMKMLKELLELNKPLKFEVYQTADFANLISVYDPDNLKGAAPEKSTAHYILLSLPLVGAILTLIWKRLKSKTLNLIE